MKKILMVIDMQNDFIDGALGTGEAVNIVPAVVKAVNEFDGDVIFTQDTHYEDYMNTLEGEKLPVKHCIKGTEGWEICDALKKTKAYKEGRIIEKVTFGSEKLAELMKEEKPDKVYMTGLCTDICVISNAMLIRAFSPETDITVYEDCCAGVTPESHRNALEAMKACQVTVEKNN
ncbi:MAG: cysteine hydrolase [Oscillospiraceae bacterium]|nr:cysteine hydrolase [Oscillospiraceae bacterium]MBQ5336891.1 cysteine hydrolase [Oscillospiraceae bacterium]